ncbi:hypothetical protein [Brachybacterium sacelli]|uniref:hypothetical protein n=1 Tax=Brachybacterium sacelli TaxID=173364 RepID=UPI00360ED863
MSPELSGSVTRSLLSSSSRNAVICDRVHPGSTCGVPRGLADCSSCLRGPTCPVPFSVGQAPRRMITG